MTRKARRLTAGHADGVALVLSDALSLWGGIDVASGCIIDRSHPDLGGCIAGAVLVMPGGRGSSSSSSILAEALRRGTGPRAIVLAVADPILTVGAIVAHSLYGLSCPIVVCDIAGLHSGTRLRVRATEAGDAEVEVG